MDSYDMTELLVQDMLNCAKRAVQDNVRHSSDSLWELLADGFPEASDEQLDYVVAKVL
jgi:hypothetical protein